MSEAIGSPQEFITGDLTAPVGRPLTALILGAGARGAEYAALMARRPDRVRVVGVAEPRPSARERMVERYRIPAGNTFEDWHDVLDRPRLADFAVVALQDAQHVEAATRLADLGYQLLLEKPMATTWDDCRAIADAVEANHTAMAVCHVLRYTAYTKALKRLIADGAVGEIVSVEHLEPVGYYHYAHSFVRGNWANEARSSFMLLAKSCHDLDWLVDIVGAAPARVSSFGSLTHFRAGNAPSGAGERCVACAIEPTCPFSAVRMYGEGLRGDGLKETFFDIASGGDPTEAGLQRLLAESPYGRCVYHTDNDVVDHQIVGIEFDNGATASFTMTAFTPVEDRHTKIFGTRGQITGDGQVIEVYDFLTEQRTTIDTRSGPGSQDAGHGGGDLGLADAFVDALYEGRPDLLVSGLESTLDSHRLVFAAERARRTASVADLSDPDACQVPARD